MKKLLAKVLVYFLKKTNVVALNENCSDYEVVEINYNNDQIEIHFDENREVY